MESHRKPTHMTTNHAIHDANNVYNSDDTDVIRRSRQDNQRSVLLPSWFVVQLTITASLGGVLFGYDLGAIAGTLQQLTNTFDLDDRQKQLSKSLLSPTVSCFKWCGEPPYWACFRNHLLSFSIFLRLYSG